MKQSLTHLISLITILLKLLKISNPPLDFSRKKNYDYLPPLNIESFFITPNVSAEVSNISPSLNQSKSDAPNRIPIKILKLLRKDISDQLAIPFSQSSSSRYFLQFWKPVKMFQFTKKFLNYTVKTIIQYICYLILTKFWKVLSQQTCVGLQEMSQSRL